MGNSSFTQGISCGFHGDLMMIYRFHMVFFSTNSTVHKNLVVICDIAMDTEDILLVDYTKSLIPEDSL